MTIIHIMLNVKQTITATNKLIFRKSGRGFINLKSCFQGIFLVEIFTLCVRYHLSLLEFPYAYTVVSNREGS